MKRPAPKKLDRSPEGEEEDEGGEGVHRKRAYNIPCAPEERGACHPTEGADKACKPAEGAGRAVGDDLAAPLQRRDGTEGERPEDDKKKDPSCGPERAGLH